MCHVIQIILQIGIRLTNTVGAKTKNADICLIVHDLLLKVCNSKICLRVRKSTIQHTDLLKSGSFK